MTSPIYRTALTSTTPHYSHLSTHNSVSSPTAPAAPACPWHSRACPLVSLVGAAEAAFEISRPPSQGLSGVEERADCMLVVVEGVLEDEFGC
jgi:hypothetical protein